MTHILVSIIALTTVCSLSRVDRPAGLLSFSDGFDPVVDERENIAECGEEPIRIHPADGVTRRVGRLVEVVTSVVRAVVAAPPTHPVATVSALAVGDVEPTVVVRTQFEPN